MESIDIVLHTIMLNSKIPVFLQNSFVLKDYNTKELFDSLNIPLNKKEKESIDKFHKTRYKVKDDKIKRNRAITRAFDNDYS